jgi:hypothetical protein
MIDALTIERVDSLTEATCSAYLIAIDEGINPDLIVALSTALEKLQAIRERAFPVMPPKLGAPFMGTRSAPAPAPTMTAADRKLERAMNAPCMGMDDE